MPPPDVSIVVLFDNDRADHLAARLRAVDRLLVGNVDCELVLVGHGDPGTSAVVARNVAATRPRLRALLHASPCSADDALVAGVEFAHGRSVVLLGRGDAPIQVDRQDFLRLPRIRGIHRYVAELMAMSFSARDPVPLTGQGLARKSFPQWLRLRWVTALVHMTPGARLPSSGASP